MIEVNNFKLSPDYKSYKPLPAKAPLLLKEANPRDLLFNKEYSVLNGVHCPLCGQKLMSQGFWHDLGKSANGITKAKDFVDLVEKNKSYLKKDTLPLLEYAEEYVKRNPNASFDDFVKVSASMARNKLSKSFNKYAKFFYKEAMNTHYKPEVRDKFNYISMWLESFMPSEEFQSVFPYKSWKEQFAEYLGGYYSDYRTKYFAPAKREIRDNAVNYNMLCYKKNNKITPEMLIKRVFNKSVSRVSVADAQSKYKFLSCSICYNDMRFSGIKNILQRRSHILRTITTYYNDIINNPNIAKMTNGRFYNRSLREYFISLMKFK